MEITCNRILCVCVFCFFKQTPKFQKSMINKKQEKFMAVCDFKRVYNN
jgi:hypothetical protein